MTTDLRCIAVQQPWAWAICLGAKDIENRTWTTKYRGTVVILASSKKTRVNALQRAAKPRGLPALPFAYSAAIGMADIVDIRPLGPDLEGNDWAGGPYCWQLANGRFFPSPIPCKAKLNLYAPEPDLAAQIREQMDEAVRYGIDDGARLWIEAATAIPASDRLQEHIESYIKFEDWANVERLSLGGLQRDPDNVYLHWRHGIALLSQERFHDALRDFDEMVRLAPEEAASHFNRARAHEELGQNDKAQADYARAREIDPEWDAQQSGNAEETTNNDDD